MEIDYVSHHLLFFASLGMGLFSGAVYDVFRLTREFVKNRVFVFFTDIVFCLYYSLAMCILFFNYSHGRIRAYSLITSSLGFAAYYFTIGRVTKNVFGVVKSFSARLAKSISGSIKRRCFACYIKACSRKYKHKVLAESSKGFGLCPEAVKRKNERSENRQCKKQTQTS